MPIPRSGGTAALPDSIKPAGPFGAAQGNAVAGFGPATSQRFGIPARQASPRRYRSLVSSGNFSVA